jgi:hypothetical protein
MKKSNGIALILVLFIVSVLLVAATAMAKVILTDQKIANLNLRAQEAFYLAEAGIERGKWELKQDYTWYTDLPHSPSDDKVWLMRDAIGHYPPEDEVLGEGKFKTIKERGKNILYSVGYLGDNVSNSVARCIIKVEYSYPPFGQLSWEIL